MNLGNNIPNHWQIKKLGEVAEIRNGKNQRAVVNPNGKYPIYGSAGEMGFADDFLCEAGTTIVGRKGTINKPIFVSTKFWNVDTAFGFCPNLKQIESKYLFFFCQSFNFHKLDKSTTIPSLAKSDLLKIDLPIPPITEQQAIVSKIEELLSDLDNGKQQLQIAQQQLKIYRQSLLNWAFEGKLTNIDVKDGDLPKGWIISNLKELKQFSIYGPRFSSNDYCKDGVAVLRTTDISERGKVDWENSPKLNLSSSDYEKYKLLKHDLLITRTGSIGRLSIFNDNKKAIPGAFLIHYRLKKDINIWYIFHFLKSQNAQNHFKNFSFGVGRPNLNVPNIELLQIPLPSLEEQQLIVDELESKLTVCDKIEETISQCLLQSETLRQSILKQAFEGKLV
jgi:type I restriction enzyme S subunit